MAPKPLDEVSQAEVLMRLRYAIDTAVAHPYQPNIDAAISIANQYPAALRSSTVRYRLGKSRWDWLHMNGIYAVGTPADIAGSPAFKTTAEPDITT
jgi:hypothetical protein